MEFKTETPTLVFDAAPAAAETALPAVKEEKMKEEIVLSEEERAQVESFSKQIDLSNSTAILNYGAGTQRKLTTFSEKALDAVRTKAFCAADYGAQIVRIRDAVKDDMSSYTHYKPEAICKCGRWLFMDRMAFYDEKLLETNPNRQRRSRR